MSEINSCDAETEDRTSILPEPIRAPPSAISQTGRGYHLRDIQVNALHIPNRNELTINKKYTNINTVSGVPMPLIGEIENPPYIDQLEATEGVKCSYCDMTFGCKRGLGVHKKSRHPVEANAEIDLTRTKIRWQEEDMRRLAVEEAMSTGKVRFLNEHLQRTVIFDPPRTIEAIKALRKKPEYRRLVELCVNMPDSSDSEDEELLSTNELGQEEYTVCPEIAHITIRDTLRADTEYMQSNNCLMANKEYIIRAVKAVLNNDDPRAELAAWAMTIIDHPNNNGGKKWCKNRSKSNISNKQKRRREYARIQELWKKNMSKAAKLVLEGDTNDQPHPSLEEQENFWRPILETTVCTEATVHIYPEPETHKWVCNPINADEISKCKPSRGTAPGPDGIMVTTWLDTVPDRIKVTIMNIMYLFGKVPDVWQDSRTVLIPKKTGSRDPALYRPLSISSVILRHFHKVLSKRLLKLQLTDWRQRAFIEADGLAENVYVLATILHEARAQPKQLHIATIDVRKAFDTVSHKSVEFVLKKKGIPEMLVKYIMEIYNSSATRLEVNGKHTSPIRPTQGVRQGDPLSTIVFNYVMDEILQSIPETIGFSINGQLINALAFADDLVLIAETKQGLQESLNKTVKTMSLHGLAPMPDKCASLSLIPAGHVKKVKVVSNVPFTINNQPVKQIGVLDTWKHLGVDFGYKGPTEPKAEIEELLKKITSAPLKPQQRLKILRTFLIPRYIHKLVFGNTGYGLLRRTDKLVRKYVRQWMALPHDTPTAFFHCPIAYGGLGIMSLETKIPELVKSRLISMRKSHFSMAATVVNMEWVKTKLRWANKAKYKDSDWPKRLYSTSDGYELKECRKSPISHGWTEDSHLAIPAKNWIEYAKVRINALPSKMRTTRGERRDQANVLCRANCNVAETTAHIIQECHRTHGGRILRHDAITNKVAELLMQKGYKVEREKIFKTSAGNRKPDLIASKGERVCILDAQIVSGYRLLSAAHTLKRAKYAGNTDILASVSEKFKVPVSKIEVSTITISWRGIWAAESDIFLRGLGLPKYALYGLTTRVLRGSMLNFIRFNQMTRAYHNSWPFAPRPPN